MLTSACISVIVINIFNEGTKAVSIQRNYFCFGADTMSVLPVWKNGLSPLLLDMS